MIENGELMGVVYGADGGSIQVRSDGDEIFLVVDDNRVFACRLSGALALAQMMLLAVMDRPGVR